jgi:hypothetical protein
MRALLVLVFACGGTRPTTTLSSSSSCGYIDEARKEVLGFVNQAQRLTAEAWQDTDPERKRSICELATGALYRIHGYVNGYNARSMGDPVGFIDATMTETVGQTFALEHDWCLRPEEKPSVGDAPVTNGQALLRALDKARTQFEAEFDAAAAGCSKR